MDGKSLTVLTAAKGSKTNALNSNAGCHGEKASTPLMSEDELRGLLFCSVEYLSPKHTTTNFMTSADKSQHFCKGVHENELV